MKNKITELVEEIFVHEGGDIEVVFKFQDAYAQVVEYIELNSNLSNPKSQRKRKKRRKVYANNCIIVSVVGKIYC